MSGVCVGGSGCVSLCPLSVTSKSWVLPCDWLPEGAPQTPMPDMPGVTSSSSSELQRSGQRIHWGIPSWPGSLHAARWEVFRCWRPNLGIWKASGRRHSFKEGFTEYAHSPGVSFRSVDPQPNVCGSRLPVVERSPRTDRGAPTR